MQYPRYCTVCNSINLDCRFNLMVIKLTPHIRNVSDPHDSPFLFPFSILLSSVCPNFRNTHTHTHAHTRTRTHTHAHAHTHTHTHTHTHSLSLSLSLSLWCTHGQISIIATSHWVPHHHHQLCFSIWPSPLLSYVVSLSSSSSLCFLAKLLLAPTLLVPLSLYSLYVLSILSAWQRIKCI